MKKQEIKCDFSLRRDYPNVIGFPLMFLYREKLYKVRTTNSDNRCTKCRFLNKNGVCSRPLPVPDCKKYNPKTDGKAVYFTYATMKEKLNFQKEIIDEEKRMAPIHGNFWVSKNPVDPSFSI